MVGGMEVEGKEHKMEEEPVIKQGKRTPGQEGVMVYFMCQSDWNTECPGSGLNMILDCLRRFYLLDEINISSLMWLDPSNHFKA
jgi:hypothetical protein